MSHDGKFQTGDLQMISHFFSPSDEDDGLFVKEFV